MESEQMMAIVNKHLTNAIKELKATRELSTTLQKAAVVNALNELITELRNDSKS